MSDYPPKFQRLMSPGGYGPPGASAIDRVEASTELFWLIWHHAETGCTWRAGLERHRGTLRQIPPPED